MLVLDNNHIDLAGVVRNVQYSHTAYGKIFNTATLITARASGIVDQIKIICSEQLFNLMDGISVEIRGEVRTQNSENNKIDIFVFCKEVFETEAIYYRNYAVIDGFVCKPPKYRKTPLDREIADILLAVNRPYGKSDYIPCICWGRNAVYAEQLEIGTRLRLSGRLQSREYVKKLSETESETRTAYEFSASKIERVVEGEDGECQEKNAKATS